MHVGVCAETKNASFGPGRQHIDSCRFDNISDLGITAHGADDTTAYAGNLDYRERIETDYGPSPASCWHRCATPAAAIDRKVLKGAGIDIRFQPDEIACDLVKTLDAHKRRLNAGGGSLREEFLNARQRGIVAPMQPKQSGWKSPALYGLVEGVHN